MVESDKDQKTEEPTDKRLRDAREEGQLCVSRELSSWVMTVAILIVLSSFGPKLAEQLRDGLRVFLDRPDQLSLEDGGLQNVFVGIMISIGRGVALVYGLLWGASILGTMGQTGFYMSTMRLKVDVSRILPSTGLSNVFSINSLVELLKSFIKMVVMGFIAYRVLKPVADELPDLTDYSLEDGLALLLHETLHVLYVLMVIITLIAIADALYMRFNFYKNLRMTKQEIKDEHKQLEGDPMVKGRLRRIRLEKARKRMMSKVPKADVVVTNPTHYSVALQYNRGEMAAPVVVAKGIDFLALRIRELAEKSEVPLVSNPPLARALYDTVEIDQPISPEQYRAVAEVISYVYRLNRKKK